MPTIAMHESASRPGLHWGAYGPAYVSEHFGRGEALGPRREGMGVT